MKNTTPPMTLRREVEVLRRRLDMKIRTMLLDAKPGDTVALRADAPLSDADVEVIRAAVRRSGLKDVEVVLLPHFASVEVLSPDMRDALVRRLQAGGGVA